MLVLCLPPTAPGVMTQAASGNGYIGYFDGGAYGIPHSSKNNIEATMLWLQFVAMNDHQADWAIAGGRITHKDTYADPKVMAVDEQADGYFYSNERYWLLICWCSSIPIPRSGKRCY